MMITIKTAENENVSKNGSFIIQRKSEKERMTEMQMFLKMTPDQQEAMFKNTQFLRFLVRDVILTISEMKSKTQFQKFLLVNASLFYMISEHYEDFSERYWNPYVTTARYTMDALIKVFHQI